jgi:hypothetical protein
VIEHTEGLFFHHAGDVAGFEQVTIPQVSDEGKKTDQTEC